MGSGGTDGATALAGKATADAAALILLSFVARLLLGKVVGVVVVVEGGEEEEEEEVEMVAELVAWDEVEKEGERTGSVCGSSSAIVVKRSSQSTELSQ